MSYISPFKPKISVSQAEKDTMLAVVRNAHSANGLALSQLRQVGSGLSLQDVEVIANALVADGKLRVERKQGVRAGSGYNLYFVAGGE